LFKVEEGFPRIRPFDVPSGVGHISYEIDLSVCQEFRVVSREEI
ncbi:MAG: PD-(D/E)XK motif protein, partial [Dissulfurispiraceae bacterium]